MFDSINTVTVTRRKTVLRIVPAVLLSAVLADVAWSQSVTHPVILAQADATQRDAAQRGAAQRGAAQHDHSHNSGQGGGSISNTEYRVGDLIIKQAFTKATPPGASNGVGYLTIVNEGSREDVLLGGSTAIADSIQVHTMYMDGDIAKMRRLRDGLRIAAGSTIALKPGGDHLMLMTLASAIRVGDEEVDITLRFKHAGEVQISLQIQPLL